MSKFRLVADKNLIKIVRKYWGKVPFNKRELEMFEKNLISGLFRPRLQGKHRLIYTAPMSVPLREYMKRGVTVHKLYSILAQTAEIVKKIERHGFYMNNLVLDERLIYVKEMTGELLFLYEPVESRDNYVNIYAFLTDLVGGVKSDSQEMQRECEQIKAFLTESNHYRVEEIEKFIIKVYPQIYQQINRVEKETSGKSGFIASSQLSYQEHYAEYKVENEPMWSGEDKGTVLLEEEEIGTTLLEEEGDTVLLAESNAKLCRLANLDLVEIHGNEFHIGKSADCEYCIGDNKAISRKHAVIFCRGNTYSIRDEDSTNHSYVNGIMLNAGVEVELRHNDVIKLANEEFEFYSE